MLVVERTAIGPLGPFAAQDVIGCRAELLLPRGIAHRDRKALRRLGLTPAGGKPDAQGAEPHQRQEMAAIGRNGVMELR